MRIRMPWCEQVNWVIYVLNVIIGDRFDEPISTPRIAIEVQAVHLHRTHLQLGNWRSSLVGVQRTESAAFSQRGWVSLFVNL